MRAALCVTLALGAFGCGDAVVETSLVLPTAAAAAGFDVSCVSAVQVFARGVERGRFPDDFGNPGVAADDIEDCVEISNVSSFADVRSAISGRIQLAIPESGLVGLDLRASTGTCNKEFTPGDPIFYGMGAYREGQDIAIKVMPNLSCNAKRTELVRPVDLLELTRTGTCPAAVPDGIDAEVSTGTVHPSLVDGAVLDYTNDFASLVGGVASVPLYTASADDSCVALEYYNNQNNMYTASCVWRGLGVCSTTAQIELPIIDSSIAYQSIDTSLLEQFGGGAVIGAIWGVDAANAKVKLAGAKVTVHPSAANRSKVVYARFDAASGLVRGDPNATATDASGLFIAYVTEPAELAFQATSYATEIVRLGSPFDISTALIVLDRNR